MTGPGVDDPLCRCGHAHATTRGPCVRYHVCGCRMYRPDPDTPDAQAARRRALLDATRNAGADRRR